MMMVMMEKIVPLFRQGGKSFLSRIGLFECCSVGKVPFLAPFERSAI